MSKTYTSIEMRAEALRLLTEPALPPGADSTNRYLRAIGLAILSTQDEPLDLVGTVDPYLSALRPTSAAFPERLTIDEVSAEYRIPLQTLRYWRVRGEGPRSFKLGRRVVYLRKDVDSWIESARSAGV